MSDVTQILTDTDFRKAGSPDQLLPLVYDELRQLAAQKLAHEKPGQTLQATALVHEAYLRLINSANSNHWNSRGHFFGAAAEAMRRILVESARRKNQVKNGGGWKRIDLDEAFIQTTFSDEDLFALDEALRELALNDPPAADLVKLRIFAGLSLEQASDALDLTRTTAFRQWTYAKAWLYSRLKIGSEAEGSKLSEVQS